MRKSSEAFCRVCVDAIADVLMAHDDDFHHGYTFSGHPVACAVALKNLDIMEREKLVPRVKEVTGPALAKLLAKFKDHPLVGEVRSMGFVGAIELVKDKKTHKTFEPVGKVGTICRDHCVKNNLIMRATRDTMLLSPPLMWTKGHIDEFMKITKVALDATAKDVGL